MKYFYFGSRKNILWVFTYSWFQFIGKTDSYAIFCFKRFTSDSIICLTLSLYCNNLIILRVQSILCKCYFKNCVFFTTMKGCPVAGFFFVWFFLYVFVRIFSNFLFYPCRHLFFVIFFLLLLVCFAPSCAKSGYHIKYVQYLLQ